MNTHKNRMTKLYYISAILLMSFVFSGSVSAINIQDDKNFESRESIIPLFHANSINVWDPFDCPNGQSTKSASTYTGGKAEISGATAKEKIWSGLKSVGLSDEIVAGIMGNMARESGFNPARYEDAWKEKWETGFDWETDGAGGHGVGLIQWSGGRRVAFFRYMREQDDDLVEKYLKKPTEYGALSGDSFINKVNNENDINALYSLELTFLLDEIQNNSAYNGILKETTVDGAADFFSAKVEACAECLNPNSTTSKERRASAQEIFKEFSGKDKFNAGADLGAKYSTINPLCDCTPSSGNGSTIGDETYVAGVYDFTDDQLGRLWNAAVGELQQDSIYSSYDDETIKNELSRFANTYEKHGGEPGNSQGLIDKVTEAYLGKSEPGMQLFSYHAGDGYNSTGSDLFPTPSPEQIEAAKDILNNGNRTLPLEIDERVHIKNIKKATNNGGTFNLQDEGQYKSGVTIIEAVVEDENELRKKQFPGRTTTFTFYQWGNGEKECTKGDLGCGDPFGYTGDAPSGETSSAPGTPSEDGPSASTSTINSDITWTEDGWIQGGIDGYVKDPAESWGLSGLDSAGNQEFATDALNKSGKGPNKILLHSLEGADSNATSARDFFSGNPYPPHFTIDVKGKHIYQHYPIYKTSSAIKSHDDLAGIQIEIEGFSDPTADGYREEWGLKNFTDEEVQYLADLLMGISDATGIPLTSTVEWTEDHDPPRLGLEEFKNYQGVLGHRHATDNDHWDPVGIWEKLERILGNPITDDCLGSLATTGEIRKLQETVLKFAWPDYRGQGFTQKKPDYDAAINKGGYQGGCGGVDCAGFVYQVITKSGWDPDLPTGPTADMLPALAASPKWTDVTRMISSNKNARPGDIIIKNGHVLLFVGEIPGFGNQMASASLCERSPMADYAEDITYHIARGFQVFRRN